ncbi:MAG: hypothetical protein EON98_07210 [Chitinophagaceae bacterium]|nr:MAG: hypothetical protein EON98_07210 [Chitinophagaceae bacterium]
MIEQNKPHFHDVLGMERNLTINYSFHSHLGPMDNYRYKQSVIGSIMLQDEKGNDLEEIGRVYLDKLLLGVAMNEGYDLFDVFDTEQYILEMGECVWDFEKNHFNRNLNRFFEGDMHESDILFIHTVEVLPAYRGMRIGETAMKDAANNFESGCGLIVVHCEPPQHLHWGHYDKEWHQKMRYELFEKDEKKAREKLIDYLKRVGFYYLPGVSEDHLFHCPARLNPNFDYIELD